MCKTFFIFHISNLLFFYFTLSFLKNTYINLSIILIYSNKIFISLPLSSLSQIQHNPHSHHHQATTIIKINVSDLPLCNKINTSIQQKKKKKPVKKPQSTSRSHQNPHNPPTHTHGSLKLNQKTRKTNPAHPPRLSLTSKSKFAKPFNSLQLN